MQTVRESIPSIDQDINAHLFQRTSETSHSSHARGTGSRAGSAGSFGRDENRAPNRAENGAGVKNGSVAASAGPVPATALVLTEAEQHKVMRERMEGLLQSINDTPRNCGPALVQLRKAVRAVPYEVWIVRAPPNSHACPYKMSGFQNVSP